MIEKKICMLGAFAVGKTQSGPTFCDELLFPNSIKPPSASRSTRNR